MSGFLLSLLKRVSDFVSSGDDDLNPRIALLYTILSIISINLSNYSIVVMVLIILSSGIYSFKRLNKFFSGIIVALPFIAFFSISTLLLTSNIISMLKNAVFIISLISISSILLNIPPMSILYGLRLLKLPKKLSIMIVVAFRIISLCSNDLINILQIYSIENLKKMEYYRKILRSFLSVLTLRAISLSEAIYVRGKGFFETEHFIYQSNELRVKELYLLFFSFCILFISILIRVDAFEISIMPVKTIGNVIIQTIIWNINGT